MESYRRSTDRQIFTIFLLIFALIALLIASTSPGRAAPTMKLYEQSHEGAIMSYQVGKNGHGVALVRECRECEGRFELKITPETKLFWANSEISFRSIPILQEKLVTMFYLPSEGTLTRVILNEPVN